jgi:FkbM family methyltransferase
MMKIFRAIFMLDRESKLHLILTRIYNAIFSLVPHEIKYRIGYLLRRHRYPYRLIHQGDIVVQIGAPIDILTAGRSRAMYFSIFTGPEGKVVVMEPDPMNLEGFQNYIKDKDIRNLIFVPLGAWKEKNSLVFLSNPSHPAANVLENIKTIPEASRHHFQTKQIQVDTVDNIMDKLGLPKIDLISITTNGAEIDILQGMRNVIKNGCRYIALARTSEEILPTMTSLGYSLVSRDDRGFTFQKIA